ncbi:MAG: NAD(P)-dependent glycerol-3-phosphate dehydrogenase [Sedimentisphaerales bacterium]|nr:NAD(P)-dependent glycerol-3-phosphate dehydrogenase [Sedimentisphaerales bacterium]
MFERITIIGDGAMGSICAMMLCEKSLRVTMWGYDANQLGEIESKRENVKFLPGHKLPDNLLFEADDSKAMKGAELIVCAVPCQFVRRVFERLKPHIPKSVPIVSVTKGIENKNILRATEILKDVLGKGHKLAALSGPTIADEISEHKPATACAASDDVELAQEVQKTFNCPYFRVYYNDDIVGVELCGATKNVIAIAAGIIDGIDAGDNAKAALVCRGLAEIERLGLALGAKEKTFSGLSGLGDLITTCISPHGRNRSFGERIGKGLNTRAALAATESVVEGAATCESVLELAKRYKVEMPITQAVHSVIAEGKTVKEAIQELMSRDLKAE